MLYRGTLHSKQETKLHGTLCPNLFSVESMNLFRTKEGKKKVSGQLSSLPSFGPPLPVTYFAHSTKRLSMVCETVKMVKRTLDFSTIIPEIYIYSNTRACLKDSAASVLTVLACLTFLFTQLLPLSHQVFFQLFFYYISVIGTIHTICFYKL